MDERDFARSEFKMRLGRIFYSAQTTLVDTSTRLGWIFYSAQTILVNPSTYNPLLLSLIFVTSALPTHTHVHGHTHTHTHIYIYTYSSVELCVLILLHVTELYHICIYTNTRKHTHRYIYIFITLHRVHIQRQNIFFFAKSCYYLVMSQIMLYNCII